MNWDNSVYTTTFRSFNGRDQITKTKRYQVTAPTFTGTNVPENLGCPSGICQEVSRTYDGHGRIKTRHYPIEDAGTATVWHYNEDDSIQQIVEPHGAMTNFLYNQRGLTDRISHGVPTNNPPSDNL